MPRLAKPIAQAPAVQPAREIATAAFFDTLAAHASKTLLFHYEGRDVLRAIT